MCERRLRISLTIKKGKIITFGKQILLFWRRTYLILFASKRTYALNLFPQQLEKKVEEYKLRASELHSRIDEIKRQHNANNNNNNNNNENKENANNLTHAIEDAVDEILRPTTPIPPEPPASPSFVPPSPAPPPLPISSRDQGIYEVHSINSGHFKNQ